MPPLMTSGPGSASVAEQPNTTGSTDARYDQSGPTGTLTFTDVDLTDTHHGQRSGRLPPSGRSIRPSFRLTRWPICRRRLRPTLHDFTGSGAGGIDWTFSIQDKDLDFLAAGET